MESEGFCYINEFFISTGNRFRDAAKFKHNLA